ncbi:PKD domain-containing protein [Aquimarina sp. 2304DJ70-9]|uniref:PKD domain-containing protein n=1 Tax=Aquimarina penaris TaxID=3231044 RepID=UPI0034629174
MKILKLLVLLCIVSFAFNGCNEDDTSFDIKQISAPTDVSANFNIAQDDSGLVTIVPTGTAASSFQIYFGDIENEEPTVVSPGSSATHIFSEGTFTVQVIGVGVTGLTSEFVQEVEISFRTPENLIITIEQSIINPAVVTVGASADFAILFDVYFGDVNDESPVSIMPGETTEHTYASPGDYTVRVVAKGGGTATAETTQVVTISDANNPVTLPIDFESLAVNYGFVSFGDAVAQVVDNANQSGINTTAKVGQLVKPAGAQVWAGTFLQLENPIDFSTNKIFKVKVFSPKSGIIVKLKVENATDDTIGAEVDVVNSVANDWEELTFDFTAIDTSNEYQKVVIFFDFGVEGDDTEYLFDDIELVNEPIIAAPTPTIPASNAISMFSDAYTDVTVDTWRTVWSDATFEEVTIADNPVKKYSALSFVGIEATTSPIDATSMTQFHMNVWSADATELRIKLVDFGADGAFGGGDDVEHEVTISSPSQGEWISLDIPLSDFTGLTTRANIAQLIYSASPSGTATIFIDNIFFHNQ